MTRRIDQTNVPTKAGEKFVLAHIKIPYQIAARKIKFRLRNSYFSIFHYISISYASRRYSSRHGKTVTSDQACRFESHARLPIQFGEPRLAARMVRCGVTRFPGTVERLAIFRQNSAGDSDHRDGCRGVERRLDPRFSRLED